MLWQTLYNRVGKQPLSFTQENHVFAVLENQATGEMERVALDIKFDAKGHPYLIKSSKPIK